MWGTGAYSDDSSVCTAAIHAGVLAAGASASIVVTIAPGQEAYPASTQNDDCKFCDYRAICGDTEALTAATKEKLADGGSFSPGLEAYRQLRGLSDD